MFETFCTITNGQGSYTVPTGHSFYTEEGADAHVEALERSYPGQRFWVEPSTEPGAYC
jgi:hypothetical protein